MSERNKICPICKAENPIEANYCRNCQYHFSEESKKGLSLIPEILSFRVVNDGYCDGSTIRLEWEVKNSSKLMLNGKDVTGKTSCNHRIQKTHTLKLTASNSFSKAEKVIELHPQIPARITDFRSLHSKVVYGESVCLTWRVNDTKRLILVGNNEEFNVTGIENKSVTLFKNTQFKLIAFSGDESVFDEKSLTIKVLPKIEEYSVEEKRYFEGDKITFRWKVSNATSISINGTDGTGRESYIYKVKKKQRTVELVASNREGSVSEIIKLTPIESPLIDEFILKRNSIQHGETTILSWKVSKASRISIVHDNNEIDVTDVQEFYVNPDKTTTYILRAYTEGGLRFIEKSVVLQVLPRIHAFELVQPRRYCEGSMVFLKWQVENASSTFIDNQEVTSFEEYKYKVVGQKLLRLTASNQDGKVTKQIKLLPLPAASIVFFKADRNSVIVGDKIRLFWEVNDAARILLQTKDQEFDVTNSKQKIISFTESQTVTLVAFSEDPNVKTIEHITIEAITKDVMDKKMEVMSLCNEVEEKKKENAKLQNRIRDVNNLLARHKKELSSVQQELRKAKSKTTVLHLVYMVAILLITALIIIFS